MIKIIKDSMKIARYSQGFSAMIFTGVIFIALGIFNMIHSDNYYMPAYHILLGLNFITLQTQSLIFIGFVGSSPKRHNLEYLLPNIMYTISAIIFFVIISLISRYQYYEKGVSLKDITELYLSGILGIISWLIFMALMFQHLAISSIFIFASMIIFQTSSVYSSSIFTSSSFGILYIKGLIIFVVGLALMLLIRKLILRHSYNSIYEKYGASTAM